MKYIEKDFPIERLNEIARREGNDKRWGRPVYQIHKWWARRLGCVFRSILLTSFLPEDISEEEYWENFFYKRTNFEEILGYSPIILDPFMGGGTTIVEALRLGTCSIGIDINPVAWFATKKEIDPFDEETFDNELRKLEETVGNKIKSFYKTKCPICEREEANREYKWEEREEGLADVMYVFWVKKVKCLNPGCKKDVHLHHTFKIATKTNKKKDKIHTIFCPKCYHIFDTDNDKKEVSCPKCQETFIPGEGYGTGGVYHCPYCNQRYNTLDSVRKAKEPPDIEIYAIEYYCPKHGRGYKPVDEYDKALYEKAAEEFEAKREELLYPTTEIPEGFNTNQARNYFYYTFDQMFNKRQLLCLSMLLEKVLEIKDENTREFMLITFSDSINANNMFCIYNSGRYELEPLFGDHHYAPPTSPVENNVWGTKYGRGTFIKYVEKLKRGIEYKEKPFEKHYETGKRVYIEGDKIDGAIINNPKELLNNKGDTMLVCATSEDLSFLPPNLKVDAVITDPPYYDNVMYSEIADFFYVWLRLGLKDRYSWFRAETTRNKREVIKNEVQKKDENFFLKGIKRVFVESTKYLKENGLFVFTFHHQDKVAWASILEPIVDAGLYAEAVYPIRSELRGGLRIVGKKAISYDTIFVCKKRNISKKPPEVSWNTLRSDIYHQTKESIERLKDERPFLGEEDIFIIALGKGLEIYSKHYPSVLYKEGYLNPRKATLLISELVDTITQEIKEAELPSGLDEVSKIYIGYLLGESYVDYDYLNKILRSRTFDISLLEREKLIEKEKKNQYKVEAAAKRYSFINEKVENNGDLSYIDKIHYLLYLYRRGKPVINLIGKWKDDTLSRTLRIYCEKIEDEDCKKVHEMLERHIEMKMPTLESFGGGD